MQMKIGEFSGGEDVKNLSEFAGLQQIIGKENNLVEVLLNEWLGLRVDSAKSCNVVGCRADVELVSHVDTKLADEFRVGLRHFKQRLCHDLSSFIVFIIILAFLEQASCCDIHKICLWIVNADAQVFLLFLFLLHFELDLPPKLLLDRCVLVLFDFH